MNQEHIYICSILEKWNQLKTLNEKGRNRDLAYFRDAEAEEKLFKFHGNIYGHLIEKLRETGLDILVGGSSAIASFPPYDYQPNDFDFYVKNINNQKISEIDTKLREIFSESKIIIFRKLITITWWIFNPEMTKLHLTIQLNTFQITSWSDLFIVYHSDVVCLGYEVKSNRFVYLKERFKPKWLLNKPDFSWGSTILSLDTQSSSARVVKKYQKRGINIKMIQKDDYLIKKYIIKTYFKDLFDIDKYLENKSQITNIGEDPSGDTHLEIPNLDTIQFDNLDDELEFSMEVIDMDVDIDDELYQRFNLDDILNPTKEIDDNQSDGLSLNLSEDNSNDEYEDNSDYEREIYENFNINSEIPDEVLDNLLSRIENDFGFDIIYQSEEKIKTILENNKIILLDSLSEINPNALNNNSNSRHIVTWRYFYQIIRQKFQCNVYRLKEHHLDKFKNAYRKVFSVSTNINDLLYTIEMPPLIDLILFKHQYRDKYNALVDSLNTSYEQNIEDDNKNYELCPVLYIKQRIFVKGQCNHHISLQAYLISFSANQSIINCPICRSVFTKLKIIFYPLTTSSKLES